MIAVIAVVSCYIWLSGSIPFVGKILCVCVCVFWVFSSFPRFSAGPWKCLRFWTWHITANRARINIGDIKHNSLLLEHTVPRVVHASYASSWDYCWAKQEGNTRKGLRTWLVLLQIWSSNDVYVATKQWLCDRWPHHKCVLCVHQSRDDNPKSLKARISNERTAGITVPRTSWG